MEVVGMSEPRMDRQLVREARELYRAWNEAKFVHQVLTAGQKTSTEKQREYQDRYA